MNRLLNKKPFSGWRCYPALLVAAILSVSCMVPVSAHADLAPFQNGDFLGGFTGWAGLLFPLSGSVNPSSDSHFSLAAGQGAQIANDDFDYMVFLSQDFQMASLSPGYDGMKVGFDLQWVPTGGDSLSSVSAILYQCDPDTLQLSTPMDLLAGIPMPALLSGVHIEQDVTAYAGKGVELCFSIADEDFLTPDFLRVGNVSLVQQSSAVPIDSSIIMLLSGLGFVGIMRRKNIGSAAGRFRSE